MEAITTDAPITEYCREQGLDITELGVYGTYPQTNHAVMQFEDNIFAYVDSWSDRTIIDPYNGESIRAEVYGTPVAWASFAPELALTATKKTDESRIYVALRHETTHSVAHKLKKYGITEAEFIEHNGIKHGDLLPGKTYHLPVAIPKEESVPVMDVDVFETPKLMHVSNPKGAQKWAFGNARTVKDIISGSGIYPTNKEIGNIVAMAYIPIEGEIFGYYMDSLALGDYKTTGKVKYMIGFAYADLSEGTAPEPAEVEVSLPIEKQIQETIATIEPEPIINEEPVLDNPDYWKATVEWFDEPETYIIDLPRDCPEILVYDLDQKYPDKPLRNSGHYSIAATFFKDGVTYGLPTQVAHRDQPELRRWYGIPLTILASEADFYSPDVDLPDRIALHHEKLTPTERTVIPALAATKLSYDRLKLYGKQLITKNKESK